MNDINISQLAGGSVVEHDDAFGGVALISQAMMQKIAFVMASVATVVSLGIAVAAGLQRAGTPGEKALSVLLGMLMVFGAHLLPLFWRAHRRLLRIGAIALWVITLFGVLNAQAEFMAFANQHAADARADTVPLPKPDAMTHVDVPAGRNLTMIAQDEANVSMDLVRLDAHGCMRACTSWYAKNAMLSAQLASLNTEADEAKRREAEEDHLLAQADQIEALRESRRADPVTSRLATMLGTTEARLELLLNCSRAVVLEGLACLCWCFTGVVPTRAGKRTALTSSRRQVVQDELVVVGSRESVVSEHKVVNNSRAANDAGSVVVLATTAPVQVTTTDAVVNPSPSPGVDPRLATVHAALGDGLLEKPTQEAIRRLLGCSQKTAGKLRRQYEAQSGDSRSVQTSASS